MRDAVAVAHQSANLDVYGLAIAPLDVPEERRPQVIAHAIVTGTDKPSRVDVTTGSSCRWRSTWPRSSTAPAGTNDRACGS